MAERKVLKKERKHCFAKIVCGHLVHNYWVLHCKLRAEGQKGGTCCRDCRSFKVCNYRCNRTFDECAYYLSKSEVPGRKLALKVDPNNEYWLGGVSMEDAL